MPPRTAGAAKRPGRNKSQELVDLYLLGIGIGGPGQITRETWRVLRRCRLVLYLSHRNDILSRINKNTRDLEDVYWTGDKYDEVYERIVRLVLDEVKNAPGVAFVTYGHPMFFDSVNLELLARSKRQGLVAKVLPAVSCLDTLCVDLGIDYGDGTQIFEANDLVSQKLDMNPNLHTLVLQLGNFGTSRTNGQYCWRIGHFSPLIDHLGRYYPVDHRVMIAFSSDGLDEPMLLRTRIQRLDSHRRRIFPGTTLYLPPGR